MDQGLLDDGGAPHLPLKLDLLLGDFQTVNIRGRISTMTSSTERAVLAGGCFWGMQDLIRKYPGVISTRVGYTGGDVPNATYRNHGSHAEAIEITFDPKR